MSNKVREVDAALKPEGRPRCGCPLNHIKGCCDVDFPRTTHGLPFTDRQVTAMAEGRQAMRIAMPLDLIERSRGLGFEVSDEGQIT